MIRSFKHKGLHSFWFDDDRSKLPQDQVFKITLILDALDRAARPGEMRLNGLRFHRHLGDEASVYSVSVNGNWRITFEWEGEDAVRVDLRDPHKR